MKQLGSEIIIKPSDILKEDKIGEYNYYIDRLHKILTEIQENLIVLRKITEFPIHLFPESGAFLKIINMSITKSTIVVFDTILHKSGHNQFTLKGLRGKLIDLEHSYLKTDPNQIAYEKLKQRIKDVGFKSKIKSLEQKINGYRSIFAHSLKEDEFLDPLTFDELDEALEIAKNLFDVLSLEHHYSLRIWWKFPLNIDEILHNMVETSYWFQSDALVDFEQSYSELSDNDKDIIDKWKAKLDK